MKNIEGFIYYMRGDLIKDVKNRYVTAYIFGHGQKIVHDTRVKLISTNKG